MALNGVGAFPLDGGTGGGKTHFFCIAEYRCTHALFVCSATRFKTAAVRRQATWVQALCPSAPFVFPRRERTQANHGSANARACSLLGLCFRGRDEMNAQNLTSGAVMKNSKRRTAAV